MGRRKGAGGARTESRKYQDSCFWLREKVAVACGMDFAAFSPISALFVGHGAHSSRLELGRKILAHLDRYFHDDALEHWSEGFLEGFGSGVADLGEEGLCGEKGGESVRDGGFVGSVFSARWVSESKAPGVEHQASGVDRLAIDIAIDRIAEKRTTEVFHVNSDLVRSSGVQMTEDESPLAVLVSLENIVVGDRRASRAGIEDRLFLSVDRVATNVSEDRAGRLGRAALGCREVKLACFAIGKLLKEGLEREVSLGGHDAAAGVLVETVHDPGAFHPPDPGQLTMAMMEEGIDEGAIGISGCWMHHHSD